MHSNDTDRPKTVADVMAARRASREAEEQRRVDAQERADKRRMPFSRGTT